MYTKKLLYTLRLHSHNTQERSTSTKLEDDFDDPKCMHLSTKDSVLPIDNKHSRKVSPTVHMGYPRRLPWLPVDDRLPLVTMVLDA